MGIRLGYIHLEPLQWILTINRFELQFGTNFLGHFLLTELLVPRLKQGAPSRVVSVSSSASFLGL